LEAAKGLSGVYRQVEYIGSLNMFTERFKGRLIEMANGDTELGVRVAVIEVLGAIDAHSLLEDEEREKLCLLLFDGEAKVRKAVSGFVRSVWEESIEERLTGKRASEKEKGYAVFKVLAILFVKWTKELDKTFGDADDDSGASLPTRETKFKEVAALITSGQKGRIALAVEALWDTVDAVNDWEGLLALLLLDHSAIGGDEDGGSSRARGAEALVDEAWRLGEAEESMLIEVFVASARRAKASARKVRYLDCNT
jgi:cohesin complex subunit SA-1/2